MMHHWLNALLLTICTNAIFSFRVHPLDPLSSKPSLVLLLLGLKQAPLHRHKFLQDVCDLFVVLGNDSLQESIAILQCLFTN